MAFQFDPRVEDAIARASARYGVPLDSMRAIAQIESGGNPAAQNPNSSAGGLYQFIDSTGKQYGLQDKYNPYENADAAGRLMRDNYNSLSGTLGRAPNAGELYLAHQQGLGGATKLLSNPNAPASQVVGSAAANLNAGQGMTAGQFANQWMNKANSLAGQAAAPAAAGVAGLAAQGQATAQGVANALPTVATVEPQVAAADPMGGIFGMLLQERMKQAPAPVPAAMSAPRKAPDNRSEEEKLASVSQTPDVYLERIRRAGYGRSMG